MPYPRRGEIYLVRFPGQPTDSKPRPALIISLDVRNRLANDVIVVPISTTLRPCPTHVELQKNQAGLDLTSMAKCEQITTHDKSFLIRGPFSGAISPSKMSEIEKAIQRAIGITVQILGHPQGTASVPFRHLSFRPRAGHLIWENLHIPDEEKYRTEHPWKERVHYLEWRTNDKSNVKVYDQKRKVEYADYKVALFYISTFDLFVEGEAVITKLEKK